MLLDELLRIDLADLIEGLKEKNTHRKPDPYNSISNRVSLGLEPIESNL